MPPANETPAGIISTGGDRFKVREKLGQGSELGGRIFEIGWFREILTSTDVNNIMSKGLAGTEGAAPTRNRAMRLMG